MPGAWGVSVIQGVGFGILTAAEDLYQGRPWIEVLPRTVAISAGFAAWMWLFLNRRQGNEVDRILNALTGEQRRMASRGAVRGELPADPQVRSAAVELVRYRLEKSLAHRTPVALLFAVFALLCLVGAVAGSLWWAGAAAVFAAIVVSMWITPRRLLRRLDMLDGFRT